MSEDTKATIDQTIDTDKVDTAVELDSEVTDTKVSDEQADSTDATDTTAGSEEEPEVDIVLEDDTGSQPKEKLPSWARNKLKKGKVKVKKAEEAIDQANARIEQLERDNKTLAQAFESNAQPKEPDPTNFDKYPDGRDDQQYIKDDRAFIISQVQNSNAQVNQQTAQHAANAKQQEISDQKIHDADERHWTKAAKLSVSDYETVHEKAEEKLGPELSQLIRFSSSNSHEIMYALGKNDQAAENLADLFATNPAAALVRVGELKTKKQTRSSIPADPESKIPGGSPPVASNQLQKEWDKAIDSDNLKRARELEDMAENKGVTIKKYG